MAESITYSRERQAALDARAAEAGKTRAELIQEEADQQADILRTDQVNAWWYSKTLAEQEALANA